MYTRRPPPQPETLIEAIRYFADPNVSLRTMVELRWPDGVRCPTCGSGEVRLISTRRLWECKHKHPRRQFSAKVGTIFEDSPLDLGKWFAAVWMVANCKNGISSYEMHRALGVTQKTAWFMDHRIRLAMKTGTFLKMSGEVEADETFIGGLAKNMHKADRERKIRGTGGSGKAAVLGIVERTSEKGKSRIKAMHVQNVKAKTLVPAIWEAVEPGATLYTDALKSYLSPRRCSRSLVLGLAGAYWRRPRSSRRARRHEKAARPLAQSPHRLVAAGCAHLRLT